MKKMFWVDCEMTGLDVKTDRLLEIAAIVTDLNFVVLDTFHRIVYQEQSVLDNMNAWCKKTHGMSGLSALVPKGTPLSLIDSEMFELVNKHFDAKEKVVLCGNSINMDKVFIDAYMPQLASRLHYRVVDVTSFKEVFRSKWGVTVQKAEGHRALDDIRESISELQHYLTFVQPPAPKQK